MQQIVTGFHHKDGFCCLKSRFSDSFDHQVLSHCGSIEF